MHCGSCGYAEPGEKSFCPSCAHPIVTAAAAPPPPKLSEGGIRIIVYSCLLFAAARGFAGLYGRYLAAEQERVEAELLGQALEHKKQVMLEQEGGVVAAAKPQPEPEPEPELKTDIKTEAADP